MRWETLGLFYTAAAKAALDLEIFPTLYASDVQRRKLAKNLTYIGDYCLEVCLAIDCLDDLQIILQYELFHLHSRIYGDQSKHQHFRNIFCFGSLLAVLNITNRRQPI